MFASTQIKNQNLKTESCGKNVFNMGTECFIFNQPMFETQPCPDWVYPRLHTQAPRPV